jgi:Protein of unknown function (DUF3830)
MNTRTEPAHFPNRVQLVIAGLRFEGTLETAAPVSLAWLLKRLPLEGELRQARWSGEAGWYPLRCNVRLDSENAMSRPQPGQILLYAGAENEPELLIPYGPCAFAYQGGPLSGNHIITLRETDSLRALGEALQMKGAQAFRLEIAVS